MEVIYLDQAIDIMNQKDKSGAPVPFKIKVVTCSLNRNTGGEHLCYERAVVCSSADKSKDFNIKGDGTNEPRSISPLLILEINDKEVAI